MQEQLLLPTGEEQSEIKKQVARNQCRGGDSRIESKSLGRIQANKMQLSVKEPDEIRYNDKDIGVL